MLPRPREVLRTNEGELAGTPFPVLLNAIREDERTCTLVLTLRALEKRILFEDGRPSACESNILHETIGRFLVTKGKLTEDGYREALVESVKEGVRFEDWVVRKGKVPVFELFRLLQANLAIKVLDCFRWRGAKWRLEGTTFIAPTPMTMNCEQLLLTGVLGHLPFDTLAVHFTFQDTQRFAVVADAPALGEVKLGPRETRLLTLLKGRRSFGELLAEGLDEEDTLRALYALRLLGVVKHAEEVPDAPAIPAPAVAAAPPPIAVVGAPAPPSPGSGSAPPAPAPPPAALFERGGAAITPAAGDAGFFDDPILAIEAESELILEPEAPPPPVLVPSPPVVSAPRAQPVLPDEAGLRDELAREFLAHRSKDPFDLLGVATDVGPTALRRAFLAAADRFSPLRFRSAEMRERAEALLVSYARAFAELSDPESLARARRRRESAKAAASGAPRKDSSEFFKISTELLDAKTQFDEARRLFDAGSFPAAADHFQYACDIEPRPLFRAWHALARWRANPNAAAKSSLQELTEAERTGQDCEEVFAFKGEIAMGEGSFDVAESAFLRAFKINPAKQGYVDRAREAKKRSDSRR